jgi:uncharacterized protein (DUF779 family)
MAAESSSSRRVYSDREAVKNTETGEIAVVLTPEAASVVRDVRAQRGDALALVIGNGCCDATAPFLFADYMPGPAERLVCRAEGVPVYVDEAIASSFEGREVVVDATDDPQPDSFSCESELGFRFVLDRLPAA